jgi:hypothetical protein
MNSTIPPPEVSPHSERVNDRDRQLSFPRFRLLVPSLAPVAIAGVAVLTGVFGSKSAGIHSSSGALLFALFALSSVVAVITEAFTVPQAIRLLSNPSLRTVSNILCVIAASVVLAVGMLWLLGQLLWSVLA